MSEQAEEFLVSWGLVILLIWAFWHFTHKDPTKNPKYKAGYEAGYEAGAADVCEALRIKADGLYYNFRASGNC